MYVARSQCETCTLHGTCSLCTALARVQTFQGLIPFFYRAKRDHALSEIIDICVCARPSGHTLFALAHAVYNMQRTTCTIQRLRAHTRSSAIPCALGLRFLVALPMLRSMRSIRYGMLSRAAWYSTPLHRTEEPRCMSYACMVYAGRAIP